jgi:hypothetical protein
MHRTEDMKFLAIDLSASIRLGCDAKGVLRGSLKWHFQRSENRILKIFGHFARIYRNSCADFQNKSILLGFPQLEEF